MENEALPDTRFDLGPALRRLENGKDAVFDCRFEPFRRAWVARQVPKERGTSLSLRTLLDAELPADPESLAGEDASPGLIPSRERRAPAVDVGETLLHLVAPRALDLGFWLADAVEKLESEECTLFLWKRLSLLK